MKNISFYAFVTTVMFAIIAGCSSRGGESSFRIGYDFGTLDKVAVVAVEGSVRSDLAQDQVADIFAMELLRKGYAPVGRAQVKALLKEQKLESADLTTIEAATEAGMILGVPAVLVVEIPHFGEETLITAKMIDVEDGSILWLGRGSGKGRGFLSTVSGAFKLEEPKTGAGIGAQKEEVLAEIAGEILGGPEGGVLSPEEAKKTQEIIQKMCKSLPKKPAVKL